MTREPLPLVRLDRVFHVGTLDPADLGRNSGGMSLEGRCLSVSLCPHAWHRIARLGGYPLHEMSRPDGCFVDMHALESRREEVVAWGLAQGLVEMRTLWKQWTADEDGSWRYMLHDSEEDAFEELEFEGRDEDDGPDSGPAVEEGEFPVATSALGAAVGMRTRSDEDATPALMMAFAEAFAGDADGMWWNEDFDPAMLSAPRGAIFPGRVGCWTAVEADWDRVRDIEAFARRPVPAPSVFPAPPGC